MNFKFNMWFSQTHSNTHKMWSHLVAALQGALVTHAHTHTPPQLRYESSTCPTLSCTTLAQHLQIDSTRVLDPSP